MIKAIRIITKAIVTPVYLCLIVLMSLVVFTLTWLSVPLMKIVRWGFSKDKKDVKSMTKSMGNECGIDSNDKVKETLFNNFVESMYKASQFINVSNGKHKRFEF